MIFGGFDYVKRICLPCFLQLHPGCATIRPFIQKTENPPRPNIIEITDFHAPELDPYARLTQNQLRSRLEPEKGIFIAESPKVISRALDAGFVPVSLLMERR